MYVYLPSEHNIQEIIMDLLDGTEKSVPKYQPTVHKIELLQSYSYCLSRTKI
jgi:hypothetical protein